MSHYFELCLITAINLSLITAIMSHYFTLCRIIHTMSHYFTLCLMTSHYVSILHIKYHYYTLCPITSQYVSSPPFSYSTFLRSLNYYLAILVLHYVTLLPSRPSTLHHTLLVLLVYYCLIDGHYE